MAACDIQVGELDTWKWNLASAARRPTQRLLSNAYFTQMGGLWICGPGFMMRGGAAINECVQDKYTLLLAWKEVEMVGVHWNVSAKCVMEYSPDF